MRILVIEDELVLRETLRCQLSRAGFNVELAADGEEGLHVGLTSTVDAAIVDLGLPKRPGLEVIRDLRARKRSFPILVLTARNCWQDKVAGLQAGADDYVCKPFQFEEVLARVQALMRRANGWATPQLICGPVVLHVLSRSLTVHGKPVDLTSYEYRVLEHLMMRAGRVVSQAELTEHLYEAETESESNVVAQLIKRLRHKIDPQGTLRPIETVYGEGYRFALARDTG